MYEEHEDGSFTLHMCEWYEQGRRLVGEYETLGDGSGFAVTDEWSTCSKVVVNHPLTRPDGTVMPGISRLRRFDWKVGPDEGLHADDYEIWERELRETELDGGGEEVVVCLPDGTMPEGISDLELVRVPTRIEEGDAKTETMSDETAERMARTRFIVDEYTMGVLDEQEAGERLFRHLFPHWG